MIFDPATCKVGWEHFVKDGDKVLDCSAIARNPRGEAQVVAPGIGEYHPLLALGTLQALANSS